MSKIKVSELKCLNEVVAVIGMVRAQVELFKAVNSNCKINSSGKLRDAFYWCNSPQGFDFWWKINSGTNPYDN